jgi:3-hydroxybutyryl-CoA dehydrogenase
MAKPFENVTIVGSGFLGTQIALLTAFSGYNVSIFDSKASAFDDTYNRLVTDFKNKKINPVIPWEKWDDLKKGIKFSTDPAVALKGADLVVEAVFEDPEVKNNVYKMMNENAPAKAIFASNSSSMPISRFEAVSGRPERVLNTHFYLPLQGMNMADLAGGTKTTQETFNAGDAWLRSLGIVPLRVKKEVLGFVFNNVWRAIKKQCLFMWGNDYADFQDIDRAWRIFTKTPFGPFGLMDSVGLDVVLDIEMVYFNDSKDPKDKPPQAFFDKVKKGELGVKTGKGFYTYPNPEYQNPDFLNPNPKK